MKRFKTLVLSGIVTLGTFSMIAYTSCKKDACKDIICSNGGTCVDGACKCPAGYEGPSCDVKSNAKFIGIFSAVDVCPLALRQGDDLKYDISILSDNTSPVKMTVIGIANTPPTLSLQADISADGKKLEINEQVLSDNRTYSGTIETNTNGTLSLSFTIKENGVNVEACTSTLTKK